MEMGLRNAQRLTTLATLIVVLLIVVKLTFALLTGSTILMADALHSISDVFPLIATWLGLKLASMPSSERFPFGLYKAENLAGLIVSFFLVLTGIEIIKSEPVVGNFTITLAVLLFSALLSFARAFLHKKSIENVKAESLKANYIDALSDTLASLALILSLFLPFLQKPMLVLIGLIVIKEAIESLINSVLALLDVSPGKEIKEKLKKEIEKVPGVVEVSELKLRKAGPFILGEVTIKTDKSIDVEKAHEIADKIEEVGKKHDVRLFVHIEPASRFKLVAIPIKGGEISETFAGAEKFLIVNDSKKILRNKFIGEKVKRGAKVARWLASQGIDCVIVRNIGSLAFMTLRSLSIPVFVSDTTDPKLALEKLRRNELKRLLEETRETV